MNVLQKAVAALNAMRRDDATLQNPQNARISAQVWAELEAQFPNGACTQVEIAKTLSFIVSTLHRAMGEPYAVQLDRDRYGEICGLIICRGVNETTIVPLHTRESVVILDHEPLYVGRASALEPLRLRLLNRVLRELEHPEHAIA